MTDPALATHGTRWSIPAGAATRDFYASIHDDREHWWALPQGLIQVGNGATFFPIAEEFSLKTVFHLPVQAARLPEGRTIADVEIHALDADPSTGLHFWRRVDVASRAASSVAFESDRVNFYALVPVVPDLVKPGELKIFSNAPGTEIYVDGLPVPGLPPLTLKTLAPGRHELKAFAPGYNEVRRTVTLSESGGIVKFDLIPTPKERPVVEIDASILDEMTVDQNIATIPGRISGSDLSGGFLVFTRNGFDSFAQIDADGNFAHVVPLDRGLNQLAFRYTSGGGVTGSSRIVKIWNDPVDFSDESLAKSASRKRQVIPHPRRSGEPPKKKARPDPKPGFPSPAPSSNARSALLEERSGKDIRATLTWSSYGDMDLHVFDPTGRHASYENPAGIPGGLLDVDDRDGFGPEVFTLPDAPVGNYAIFIHHFYDLELGPGTATLQVALDGKHVYQGSTTLWDDQHWEAYRLEVRASSIRIIAVDLPRTFGGGRSACYENGLNGGNCENYVFTTAAGENLIKVRAEASPDIDPAQIRYQVFNVTDQAPVSFTGGTGNTLLFPASSRGLSSLTSPPLSRALLYQVRAYTDSGLTSDPIYIGQDVRSQIRQEFVDKRRFLGGGFTRETPVYGAIGDGSIYGPSFLASPFAGASQHFVGYGLTIVRRSRTYFDRLQAAGIPVRLTSHWRNPRYNDSLGASNSSEVNSHHQTGDAIDVNPFFEKNRWPAEAKTYDEAREILRDKTRKLLTTEIVIFHGKGINLHIHIQP